MVECVTGMYNQSLTTLVQLENRREKSKIDDMFSLKGISWFGVKVEEREWRIWFSKWLVNRNRACLT